MLSNSLLDQMTRIPGMRRLWHHFPIGRMSTRVRYGISPRPHYAYGVFSAANLAKRLGIGAISVIELGVAGGRGLVALENIATEVSREIGIDIAVFGFDGGTGMPPPVDYRDLPFMWKEGDYKMDVEQLRAKLKYAQLLLGDIKETIPAFAGSAGPRDGVHFAREPIGFIAFDLDYYSSTKYALRLFEAGYESRLPRVFCYFDDIISDIGCHNEFLGELCAIREFNLEHEDRKLCPIHMMRYILPHPARWKEQIYVLHDFHHPLYCRNITRSRDDWSTELPL